MSVLRLQPAAGDLYPLPQRQKKGPTTPVRAVQKARYDLGTDNWLRPGSNSGQSKAEIIGKIAGALVSELCIGEIYGGLRHLLKNPRGFFTSCGIAELLSDSYQSPFRRFRIFLK